MPYALPPKNQKRGAFPHVRIQFRTGFFHDENAVHQHRYAGTILIERNACHANDGEIK